MTADYEVSDELVCSRCGIPIYKGGAIIFDHEIGESLPVCVKHMKEACGYSAELQVRWGWAMTV